MQDTGDPSSWTERTYETAFQTIDKKQLNRKICLGLDKDRKAW
jgi:hypothetical protein